VAIIEADEVGMELATPIPDTLYMRSNGSAVAVPQALNASAATIAAQEGVYERFLLFTFVIGVLALLACPAVSQQSQDKSMANMPGMDMSSDMRDMGPSWIKLKGRSFGIRIIMWLWLTDL